MSTGYIQRTRATDGLDNCVIRTRGINTRFGPVGRTRAKDNFNYWFYSIYLLDHLVGGAITPMGTCNGYIREMDKCDGC